MSALGGDCVGPTVDEVQRPLDLIGIDLSNRLVEVHSRLVVYRVVLMDQRFLVGLGKSVGSSPLDTYVYVPKDHSDTVHGPCNDL